MRSCTDLVLETLTHMSKVGLATIHMPLVSVSKLDSNGQKWAIPMRFRGGLVDSKRLFGVAETPVLALKRLVLQQIVFPVQTGPSICCTSNKTHVMTRKLTRRVYVVVKNTKTSCCRRPNLCQIWGSVLYYARVSNH